MDSAQKSGVGCVALLEDDDHFIGLRLASIRHKLQA